MKVEKNVSRKVKCFNLHAIIAVGYRVNEKSYSQFRQLKRIPVTIIKKERMQQSVLQVKEND